MTNDYDLGRDATPDEVAIVGRPIPSPWGLRGYTVCVDPKRVAR